jgi:TetR/AcrR family transcriptional regulator
MESIETRERILLAAKREFAEKGFDGARMGAIAKKAEANQALIHYYFQSKENLYEQVLQRIFGVQQKTQIIGYLDKYKLTPSERLYMQIYFLVKLYMGHKDPDFERILMNQNGIDGWDRVISIINKFFLPQFQVLENTLMQGVESGEFESKNIMFIILELLLYPAHYENFRKFFKNTQWYNFYYGKDYIKNVFDFLIENTFKALCPVGKKVVIPSIPKNIIKEAGETIDSMITQMQGGVNE